MFKTFDSKYPKATLLFVLLGVGLFLHLFRLGNPDHVVFDEVHFGRFVNAYLESQGYYFDVHPPHGKLLIAGVAALGGYTGDQNFERIHQPYETVDPALMRIVPALSGIAIPLVAYALLLQLGASRWAAFLGGWMLAWDNGLLIQTRIIALDGFMVLCILAACAAGLRGIGAKASFARIFWVCTAGAFAGGAIGIKWTGLAGLGVLGLLVLADFLSKRDGLALRRSAIDSGLIVAFAAAVYVAGWAIHFAILDQPGPGDAWGAPTGRFGADFAQVHEKMWSANSGLDRGHPYSSAWWTWPLMLRPISYWTSGTQHLHFIGNPVVWWGSTIGLAALFIYSTLALLRPEEGEDRPVWPKGLWVLLAGYLGAYVPLAFVTRVLFLYHYLTPLVLAVCALALWLDGRGWIRPGHGRDQPRGYWAAVVLVVVGFVLVSPFSLPYIDASGYQSQVFRWFRNWL